MTSNADNWEEHWTQQGAIATKNPAQQFRHALVLKEVHQTLPQSILDVGCGQGDLLSAISALQPSISLHGIELSSVGAAMTRTKVPQAAIYSRDLTDPHYTPVVTGVSCLTCVEVLEHLDDPTTFLSSALKHLIAGGRLVLTVPSGPMTAFDKSIGHRQHFTRSDLKRIMQTVGLQNIKIRRVGFPFFNLYRLTVLLRGKRLVEEVGSSSLAESKSAQFVMAAFGVLFRFNINRVPLGWQLIAVATKELEVPQR